MRDTLRRMMYSRVACLAVVVLWISLAGEFWYDALRQGFSSLKIVQVVLVTGLAVVVACEFAVNRAWRKRNDDAR